MTITIDYPLDIAQKICNNHYTDNTEDKKVTATSQHHKNVDLRKYLQKQLLALRPSDPLPSVREIMRDCSVSQTRVEDLLDEFQTQGLIERVPRRGIFKTAATDSARFVPMIDIIYCGITNETRGLRTGFHAELVDALARQVSERHQGIRVHQLPVGSTHSDFVPLLSKSDLMACIVIGLETLDLVNTAQERHISWVSLFPQTVAPTQQTILISGEEVVRKQLEHLWELGHERIAYMHVVDEKIYHRDHVFRREAFYKLMAERGVKVNPEWVRYGDYFEAPFRASFSKLFETKPYPTAVILADQHLPWAYKWLREKGMVVGQDISLVGTDDLILACTMDPPATTLRVPRAKAATMALQMLDRIIAGDTENSVEYLPVELIVRESAKCLLHNEK